MILIAIFLAACQISGGLARAATPEQVEQAIQKAKAYLLSTENLTSKEENAQFWEFPYNHQREQGGATSLVVYSLLAAGEDPKEPAMARAIEYLRGVQMTDIYATGLRLQVWHNLPIKEVRNVIGLDAEALMKAAHPTEDVKGKAFFGYELVNPDYYDHSNSQYGVLGLWAAAEAGGEIPIQLWLDMDQGWRTHQLPDGGWAYRNVPDKDGNPPTSTPTMTAAGIATLYITQQEAHGADAIDCKGNSVDKNIDKGLQWMGKFYGKGSPNYRGNWGNYLLYGIDRIGVASGHKYFGTVDWFQDGAEYLVRSQQADGSWDGTVDTAYGLLFLAYGRAPVVMNKLEYSLNAQGNIPKPANWNERPRDAANFVKWAGKQSETALNWQVVNLKVPVEELHDAPLLYITGNQALSFTKEEEDKLRLFVEQGGIIVGNADCGTPTFSESFKKLGGRLFGNYEFTVMPADHVIYTDEQFHPDKWKNKPKLEVLGNGARVLMLLFPSGDPSRFWQADTRGGHEEYWQLMDDIFIYSVDKKGLHTKGSTYIVTPDPKITATKTIKVARLEYGGNWDPEPGGLRRLGAVMHNLDQTDLKVENVKLGSGKLDSSYTVADLTGTTAFKLDEASKAELRKFVEGGGTLVVDAAGGSGEFQASAESALGEVFPGKRAATLKPGHAVFAGPEPIKEVAFRPYAKKIVGATKTPRLKGIDVGTHTGVFVSAEDLSVGLVGQEVDGVLGYEPASATALMRNMLVYAAGARAPSGGAAAAATEPAGHPATSPAAKPAAK